MWKSVSAFLGAKTISEKLKPESPTKEASFTVKALLYSLAILKETLAMVCFNTSFLKTKRAIIMAKKDIAIIFTAKIIFCFRVLIKYLPVEISSYKGKENNSKENNFMVFFRILIAEINIVFRFI